MTQPDQPEREPRDVNWEKWNRNIAIEDAIAKGLNSLGYGVDVPNEKGEMKFGPECHEVQTISEFVKKALDSNQSSDDQAVSLLQEMAEAHAQTVKYHWFDGTKQESDGIACSACMFCDMGDSGRPRNSDGHDFDCTVSLSHKMHTKYQASRFCKKEGDETVVDSAC